MHMCLWATANPRGVVSIHGLMGYGHSTFTIAPLRRNSYKLQSSRRGYLQLWAGTWVLYPHLQTSCDHACVKQVANGLRVDNNLLP